MEDRDKKLISDSITFMNIGLLLYLAVSCLQIVDINYFGMGIIILVTLLLFYLIDGALKDSTIRIILFICTFLLVCFWMVLTKGSIVRAILEELYNTSSLMESCIINNISIPYYNISLYFNIIIPPVTIILLLLNRKFLGAATVVSTAVFIFCWYLIFYNNVIRCIPFYLAVSFITIGARAYLKKRREYMGTEVKLNISVGLIVKIIVIGAVLIPCVIRIMPQEFEGKSFSDVESFLNNRFTSSGKDVRGKIYNNQYSIGESGYSDSSKSLGGSVTINNGKAFKVKADKLYYLRGRVKYKYDGESWSDYGKEAIREIQEELSSYSTTMDNPNEVLGGSLEGIDIIEITPDANLKTSTFFTPETVASVEYDYGTIYIDNVPMFASDILINHPYKVKVNTYGNVDDCLQDISEFYLSDNLSIKSKASYYPIYIREYGDSQDEFINRIKFETKKGNSKMAYNSTGIGDYLQVPDSIDRRVYDLVHKILSDEAAKQKVGIEYLDQIDRATAIKDYLKKNYAYKTIVKEQKHQDFVSDFLINSKSGYCTYFASASTIMCRIAGVPARYVEGFNMNGADESEGIYQIRNSNAHAWCEVLVGIDEDKWSVLDAVPAAETYDPYNTQIVETYEPGYNKDYINEKTHDQSSSIYSGMELGEEGSIRSYYKYLFVIAVILILITLLILINKIFLSIIIGKDSIIPFYKYILKRLSTIDIIKPSSKGELEFAESIEDEELRIVLTRISKSVYSEYYGGEFDVSIERGKELKELERIIKSKESISKYILKKYLIWGDKNV